MPLFNPTQVPNWAFILKNADYDLIAFDDVLADTSADPFTLTLPGSPTVGEQIVIQDAQGTFGTNNLTVARNGNFINGVDADVVYSTNGERLFYVFAGGDIGWCVANIGAAAGGVSQQLCQLAFGGFGGAQNQAWAGGGGVNQNIFDQQLINVGGAYNTSTGIFTAPSTNLYFFQGFCSLTSSTGGEFNAYLTDNTTGSYTAYMDGTISVGAPLFYRHITTLNAGDQVQVGFVCSNDETTNTTQLDIFLIA